MQMIIVFVLLLIWMGYKYQQGMKLTKLGLTDGLVALFLVIGTVLLW